MGATRTVDGARPFEPSLEIPERIGRYRVLDVIGSGGMGVVCTAYDPKLDRKVAMKLLRGEQTLSENRRQIRRARLVREAQALARLSHPNIVAVHDVDVHDDLVYMAMEYVEGQDLERWLRTREPTWREIVDVFMAAGQGLAAAHEAGLTHRDFKPTNVLVGFDRRVRVVDFGLAKGLDESSEASSPGLLVTRSGEGVVEFNSAVVQTVSSEKLTQAGRCVGTPAYMAPEQQLAEEVGPAADQFSFGVALFESLYGRLPFGDADDAFWRIVDGRIASPPASTKVPAWVHRVVLRMLEAKIERRFPSMADALAALAADPAVRRRKLWSRSVMGVGIAGIGAASMFSMNMADPSERPCEGAEARMGGLWNDSRQASLVDAFEATGTTAAGLVSTRVVEALDGWSAHWVKTHTEVCEATRVHGQQSDRLLDLRMNCLEEQRAQVASLIEIFLEADREVVSRSIDAVGQLELPSRCAGLDSDPAQDLPEDPQVRSLVQAAQASMASARAQLDAGRMDAYFTSAEEALKTAEASRHRPTMARALTAVGRARVHARRTDEAEAALREAVMVASEVKDATTEAEAFTTLTALIGIERGRLDEALGLEQAARAALRRAGDPPEGRVELECAIGRVLSTNNRYDDAVTRLQRALELAELELGHEHPSTVMLLSAISSVQILRSEYELAEEASREAHARALNVFGPTNPMMSNLLAELSSAQFYQGRFDEAKATIETALATAEETYGKDHARVLEIRSTLARTLTWSGDLRGAAAHMRPVIAALRERGESTTLRKALEDQVRIDRLSNDLQAADEGGRELRALFAEAMGEDHLHTAIADLGRCRVLNERGMHEEAAELATGVLRIVSAPELHDHQVIAWAKTCRAVAWARLGRSVDAHREAQAAHAALGLDVRRAEHGEFELSFQLGWLLWKDPSTRALAEQYLRDADGLAGHELYRLPWYRSIAQTYDPRPQTLRSDR